MKRRPPSLVIGRGNGGLLLDPPLLSAPMAGVTDPPYRGLLHELGCDFSTTEMVSARGICEGNPTSTRLLFPIPKGHTAVQLFGSDPDMMRNASDRLTGEGFSAIDINAGCPKRKVHSQGSGGALLKDHDRLLCLVEAVLEGTDLPVGVKLRSGWDAFEPVSFKRLVSRLSDAGVSYITIHGRTVMQGFRGAASASHVRIASSESDVPIIASGDITGPEGVNDYLTNGASGFMIGRALMGDPSLFRRLRASFNGEGFHERYERAVLLDNLNYSREHLFRVVAHYGESRGVIKFRSHLAWYIKGVDNRASLSMRVASMKNESEALEIISKALEMLEVK
ncbi:MAG: tRNA-dihydrouridine synthase [Candidatus Thermoplasmatota archaeon]|nr:tRNA-dihydrouridine synthase [Candidatus Thermoplasmatota archaeon]